MLHTVGFFVYFYFSDSFFSLSVEEGRIVVDYDLGSGRETLRSAQVTLATWHTLTFRQETNKDDINLKSTKKEKNSAESHLNTILKTLMYY
jgi:hypothetical protein